MAILTLGREMGLLFPNRSSLHRKKQVYWLGHSVTEMVTLIMKQVLCELM